MNKQLVKIFSICFLLEFLVCIESSSMLPLMTYLADFFNIKPSFILYVNLGFFLVGLTVPFVGLIGDKLGDKKIICYAVLLSTIGIFITGIAKSAFVYGLGRTFSGFAYILMNSVLISYISSFTDYENRGKATGVIKVAFGTGVMVGPMIATYFVNKYSLFVYYAGLSSIVFIAFLLSLTLPQNKAKNDSEKKSKGSFDVVFKNKSAIKLLVSFFLFLSALYLELNFLSLWLADAFKLPIDRIGMIFTIGAMGTITGILMCVYLADKLGKHRFSTICMVITLLAYILLRLDILNNNVYIVIGITFMLMAGVDGAITSIQAMSSELFTEQRSFFMTLTGMTMSLGGLMIGLVGPVIYDSFGFVTNITISCVLCLASILIFRWIGRDKDLMKKLGEAGK